MTTALSDAGPSATIPGELPSQDAEIFEVESHACSPLLLSGPGFSEFLDLNPPGGEFISDEVPRPTEEPGCYQISHSEYAPVAASPSEVPLLFNPTCSSVLSHLFTWISPLP